MCRDLFDEFMLVSVRVRQGRLSVGTFSTRSGNNRYVFGEVGLLSGLFGEVWLLSGLFGEIGLVSGCVRRVW